MWWKRIARYIIGVVGVALLWYGLGGFIHDEIGVWGNILDYLLFAVMGIWISALAPLLFKLLKLVDPKINKTP